MKLRWYWLILVATFVFLEGTWKILVFVQHVRTIEDRVQRLEVTEIHDWAICARRTDAVEHRLDQRVDSLDFRMSRIVNVRMNFP